MKFLTSTEIVSSLKFPQIISIKTENCNMPFDQKQDSNINLSISSLYHYLFNRPYIQLYYLYYNLPACMRYRSLKEIPHKVHPSLDILYD